MTGKTLLWVITPTKLAFSSNTFRGERRVKAAFQQCGSSSGSVRNAQDNHCEMQQAKSENERLRQGFGKCVWKDISALKGDKFQLTLPPEKMQYITNDLVDGFKEWQVVSKHTKDVRAEDDVLEE
uniref:AlNc14C52G4082 protein n=1 Tax=Albugo laibachii Nc14 TaxID=890382 RepID=F0WBP0_9STRA|nr:AlNc14C52G4082 [Albugo laibachii Nc14]|eukprot:CCA18567.1 AlNc14C52G4082 [Albugo laibachii Nc14]